MAWSTRETTPESIIHADHGAQFTSWAFTNNVDTYGLRLSLGTVGDCYDNAMIESFLGPDANRTAGSKKWATILELSAAMADYIDSFHNDKRRHSSLDMLTTTEYEQLHAPLLQLR